MFKYTYFLFILLFVCEAYSQHDVKGSGYILTQQRKTEYFNSIDVSSNISVYLVQGEFQPITIEADDNLFPYIKTIVRNQVLKIYIPDTVKITKFTDMNVLISMPSLTLLQARQSSHINASPQVWDIQSVIIKASSGSRIRLAADAMAIKVEARTSAIVDLRGKTTELNAELKTSARLNARDLKVSMANLEIATRARAEIRVSKQLKYDVCANSRLIYRGEPQILKAEVKTGSRVIHDK